MPRVELKTLWVDDDGMLSVSVTASNGQNSNSLETYIYPEQLLEFAGRLESFPTSRDDTPLLESGAADPKWHDHLQIRAFVRDEAGHSALEFHMESRGAPPVAATSHFYLSCNPADVNNLGAEIRQWVQNPSSSMSVEWRNET
jgi:hypothetical protein